MNRQSIWTRPDRFHRASVTRFGLADARAAWSDTSDVSLSAIIESHRATTAHCARPDAPSRAETPRLISSNIEQGKSSR
jgi:hypothetical protein